MTNGQKALTFDQICRRAGGRRRYNLARKQAAEARLQRVEAALSSGQNPARAERERLASVLAVTVSTINRDVRRLQMTRRLEESVERLFPAEENYLQEWEDLSQHVWERNEVDLKPPKSPPLNDRRGGRRPHAGRKKSNYGTAEKFEAELFDFLGPEPQAWQLDVIYRKLAERALWGNTDATRLLLSILYPV